MLQIFLNTLVDTALMLPFLLAIYIFIELIEYKFEGKIRQKVQTAGSAGPAVGAIAGVFPQCGFSVVTTALYTQRLVTIGTLIAVYLSTSDEAIPIILSRPDKLGILWPLILTKVVIAIIAGYAIDFAWRKKNKKILAHIEAYAEGKDVEQHHHESINDESACCGHNPSSGAKKFNPREIFLHPLVHTAKIFVFIFIASFLINLIIFKIGENTLAEFLRGHLFWQPFIAGLVGLIPNCAASVALTELYLKGVISYGSAIAGLCASGGLGLLILAREEKNKRQVLGIITLLFGVSVVAGLIIQGFF